MKKQSGYGKSNFNKSSVINGILCRCMEKARTSKMPFLYNVKQGIYSSTIPTIVEPKAVFMGPSLLKFLIEINKFVAYIFI